MTSDELWTCTKRIKTLNRKQLTEVAIFSNFRYGIEDEVDCCRL